MTVTTSSDWVILLHTTAVRYPQAPSPTPTLDSYYAQQRRSRPRVPSLATLAATAAAAALPTYAIPLRQSPQGGYSLVAAERSEQHGGSHLTN